MKHLQTFIFESNGSNASCKKWLDFFTQSIDEYEDELDDEDIKELNKLKRSFAKMAKSVKVYSSVPEYWDEWNNIGNIQLDKKLPTEIENLMEHADNVIEFEDLFTCFVNNNCFYIVSTSGAYNGDYFDAKIEKA